MITIINNGEKIGDYILPGWFTRDTLAEFFSMWTCFNRTAEEYYQDNLTKLNFERCRGKVLIGDEEVEGQYIHKSANIGWIFDGKQIYHVSNAKPCLII